MEGEEKRPLLADGSIVGDYTPLFKYWEIASRRARRKAEEVVLRNDDFAYLEGLVRSRGVISAEEALETLTRYFEGRVDALIAYEAVREAYGAEPPSTADARRMIARILAGWLLEASKIWGSISMRGAGRGKGGDRA